MLIFSAVMITMHFWIFTLRMNGYPYFQPKFRKTPRTAHFASALSRQWWSYMTPNHAPFSARRQTFVSHSQAVPTATHDHLLGSNVHSIAIDNCSTHHVTPEKSDFVVGSFVPGLSAAVGLGGDTSIAGTGTVHWEIIDDDGVPHLFCLHDVSYVPTCPYRLISIDQLSKHFDDYDTQGTIISSGGGVSNFIWDHGKFSRQITHQASPAIPIVQSRVRWENLEKCFAEQVAISPTHPDQRAFISTLTSSSEGATAMQESFVDYCSLVSEGESEPADTRSHLSARPKPSILSPAQQTLKHWHERLGHELYSNVRQMSTDGVIPALPADSMTCLLPVCVACLHGKATRTPWRTSKRGGNIRDNNRDHQPGGRVHVDHMECSQPGLIGQTSGILMNDSYNCATIFCDGQTGKGYVHLQSSTDAKQTMNAKIEFERLCERYGVRVRSYHSDNGRFAERTFVTAVKNAGQDITHCGVGAHHQNGIAERYIRTLSNRGRTMLQHAYLHWPEATSVRLWPYALKLACHVENHVPSGPNGRSKAERFAQVDAPGHNFDMHLRHTFGCPVFVLRAPLQSGFGVPRWDPRTRVGLYLGVSDSHAGTVALVLNLQTGHVSPQYHVVFDDDFTTVESLRLPGHSVDPATWKQLCETSYESFADSERVEALNISELFTEPDESTADSNARPSSEFDLLSSSKNSTRTDEPKETPITADAEQSQNRVTFAPSVDSQQQEKRTPRSLNHSSDNTTTHQESSTKVHSSPTQTRPNQVDPLTNVRRSNRDRRAPNKLSMLSHNRPSRLKRALGFVSLFIPTAYDPVILASVAPKSHEGQIEQYSDLIERNVDETANSAMSQLLSLVGRNQDTMTFKQSMKEKDADKFREACEKELHDHTSREHWSLVPRASVPRGHRPIQSVWSMKRKRIPGTGELQKHKARLCAHGGQQVYGVNYWETYAPVVQWMSVRVMLCLSIVEKLHSRSIDFVLAYPQADLDIDMFMELPLGVDLPPNFDRRLYVLKLHKNLYGLKQAGHNWHVKLKDGLLDLGFKPCLTDPCVFTKRDLIVLVFVDDCLIFSRDKAKVDGFIDQLRAKNFDLTDEGDIQQYLGIDVKHRDDGTIELRQPFLIENLIKDFEDEVGTLNSCREPATPKQSMTSEGDARKWSFSYPSYIGRLNFLSGSTRPDIAYATHRCARFSKDPKACHEDALKKIIRYLKKTADKGMIISPDRSKGLECYVDASFCEGWSTEVSDDPTNCYSRTGYVIRLFGCPIIWVSKLQTEITLSTTESEYVALSQAMRDVIPLLEVLNHVQKSIDVDIDTPVVRCTVFEDNQGALELAIAPKMRPRTRHIAVKYHHFREHVERGLIKIVYVDTKNQLADMLTKALPFALLQPLRQSVLGW
jgi:hypothetical protein